ncbi:hypothetical protein RSPO_c02053 [Ralstonia solanacearum Po82]|uniref:Uncharacterized protein n=1 Tax=Ralstonia solanacearum (strain Po82) TaxID=1031711 RepID=F6G2Y5_RALS8|nr:hypothetical protein RSPO_c02053 [Ralstonia solanacearum Po82]
MDAQNGLLIESGHGDVRVQPCGSAKNAVKALILCDSLAPRLHGLHISF